MAMTHCNRYERVEKGGGQGRGLSGAPERITDRERSLLHGGYICKHDPVKR
jgi:hypothetical protein